MSGPNVSRPEPAGLSRLGRHTRQVRFYTENGRFAFLSPLGGLGATYDDHLKLIGKHVVDFLLVLIELFSLGVTAKSLRANIGSKSAISL